MHSNCTIQDSITIRPESRYTGLLAALVLGLILGLAAGTSSAQPSFTEDFSTTDYLDASETSADWNTSVGELRMFPFTPTRVASHFAGARSLGVDIDGKFAFLANGTNGLRVIDISVPGIPTTVALASSGGEANDVVVDGEMAFVAAGNEGLQIFNAWNPNNGITYSGGWNTASYAFAVDIADDVAFVADSSSGLVVIDISNVAAPTALGSYNTIGTAYDVIVDGDFAYIADGTAGLVVLDISIPDTPVLAWVLALPGTAQGLALAGDHIYVASGNSGLHIVDRAPNQPAGNLVATYVGPNYIYGLTVSGNRAYVCDEDGGLMVLDVSNPAAPVVISSIVTNGSPRDVCVVGRHAFVADEGEGLDIILVSNLVTPTPIAVVPTGDVQNQIVVRGDLTYVAGGDRGLQVFDSADPANPMLVGSYDFGGDLHATGLDLAGNFAFVADSVTEALFVVDISYPAIPQVAGALYVGYMATGIVVDGDLAYVTALGMGLVVLDISDPASPAYVGELLANGGTGPMVRHGNLIYLISQNGDVDIFDISDPTAVSLVNSLTNGGDMQDLVISGDYLYVADGVDGLLVYSILNPTVPALISNMPIPSGARGIAINGDFVVLSKIIGGIEVVYIGDPYAMYTEITPPATGYHGRITIDGHLAYVAGGTDGIRIYPLTQDDTKGTIRYGVSTNLIADGNAAVRVRLTSQQTGDVSWRFSNDGIGALIDIPDDNSWTQFSYAAGPELIWRAKLKWQYGVQPTVSEVQFEWLHAEAEIQAITDIGNDQGRKVRLEWLRSGHDFVGDANQIAEYAIYRRIDNSLPAKALGVDLSGNSSALQQNAQVMKAAGWDFVTTVPVLTEDEYAVVVPTLADSTIADGPFFSTFKVVALTATPGVFFTSAPDSGYSLDNLAPNVPAGFLAAYHPTGVDLDWVENTETDFRFYRVYRGTDPGFVPAPENLVQELTGTAWTDASAGPWAYHYKITAVDFAGNESEAGEVASASDVPDAGSGFVLQGAVPNPFNPSTEISYRVAEAGKVQLTVYDVSGRRVATLVDEDQAAGAHRVVWRGQDQHGNLSASGVYLYQLRSGGKVAWRRMTLLK